MRIPRELTRFRELPMTVSYHAPGDAAKKYSRVFQLAEINEAEVRDLLQMNIKTDSPQNYFKIDLTQCPAPECFAVDSHCFA